MDDIIVPIVSKTLKENANLLNDVSQEIWKNPELKFEENHAHAILTKILEEKGFAVQKSYVLPTAFRAEYNTKSECLIKSPNYKCF